MASSTGLAQDPAEYRRRLEQQPDEQVDAWAAELMRDLSIRVGVRRVIGDVLVAARVNEREFEHVFAAGGGVPATLGRTADGELMVPAIELWCIVRGIRAKVPDARERLIDYLVGRFGEMVYL